MFKKMISCGLVIAVLLTWVPFIQVYADTPTIKLVINGNNGTATSSGNYFPTWTAVDNLVVAVGEDFELYSDTAGCTVLDGETELAIAATSTGKTGTAGLQYKYVVPAIKSGVHKFKLKKDGVESEVRTVTAKNYTLHTLYEEDFETYTAGTILVEDKALELKDNQQKLSGVTGFNTDGLSTMYLASDNNVLEMASGATKRVGQGFMFQSTTDNTTDVKTNYMYIAINPDLVNTTRKLRYEAKYYTAQLGTAVLATIRGGSSTQHLIGQHSSDNFATTSGMGNSEGQGTAASKSISGAWAVNTWHQLTMDIDLNTKTYNARVERMLDGDSVVNEIRQWRFEFSDLNFKTDVVNRLNINLPTVAAGVAITYVLDDIKLSYYREASAEPEPPTVSIDNITGDISFPVGQILPIQATVTSSGGDVEKVEAYLGDTLVGEITEPGNGKVLIKANTALITEGDYKLKLVATDSVGLTGESETVNMSFINYAEYISFSDSFSDSDYAIEDELSTSNGWTVTLPADNGEGNPTGSVTVASATHGDLGAENLAAKLTLNGGNEVRLNRNITPISPIMKTEFDFYTTNESIQHNIVVVDSGQNMLFRMQNGGISINTNTSGTSFTASPIGSYFANTPYKIKIYLDFEQNLCIFQLNDTIFYGLDTLSNFTVEPTAIKTVRLSMVAPLVTVEEGDNYYLAGDTYIDNYKVSYLVNAIKAGISSATKTDDAGKYTVKAKFNNLTDSELKCRLFLASYDDDGTLLETKASGNITIPPNTIDGVETEISFDTFSESEAEEVRLFALDSLGKMKPVSKVVLVTD